MSVHFKIVPHSQLRDVEVVEVWVDDKMVSAIYPQLPSSIRIISRHIAMTLHEADSPDTWRFIFDKFRS